MRADRIKKKLKEKECPNCGGWLFRFTYGRKPMAFKCFRCGYHVDPPPDVARAYEAIRGH